LIRHDLADLNWKILLIMGLLFSGLNTAFNQLVLYWNQMTINMMDGMLIMFVGDITGVLLVIGLIRAILAVYKPNRSL